MREEEGERGRGKGISFSGGVRDGFLTLGDSQGQYVIHDRLGKHTGFLSFF